MADRLEAQVQPAIAVTRRSSDDVLIAHLKLQIGLLRRDCFSQKSGRTTELLDQLELKLEELEAAANEDELAVEAAVAKPTNVAAFTRQRPACKPFPEHLPRQTGGYAEPCHLRLLRRRASVQVRRGYHQDPVGYSAAVESHPARP